MFEWADGGNLRNLWNANPHPNRQPSIVKATIEQLLGLAEALCACHFLDSKGSNYRHGDLKPDNILWYQDTIGIGNLKIGDWGIAKGHNLVTEDRPYKTTTPYGTRRYEAPEVVTGLKRKYEGQSADRRSRLYDIWAMGCITLEFTIWLLYGLKGLDKFNESINGPLEGNTPFYEVKRELGGTVATVHTEVVKWMDRMAGDPACQKYTNALGDLLDLVRTGLLVVRLPRKMGSNLGMGIDAPADTALQTPTISQESSVAGAPALVITPAERIPVQPGPEPAGDYRLRADQFRDKLKLILDEDNGDSYWFTGMPQPPSSIGESTSISSLMAVPTSNGLGAAKGLAVHTTRAV